MVMFIKWNNYLVRLINDNISLLLNIKQFERFLHHFNDKEVVHFNINLRCGEYCMHATF